MNLKILAKGAASLLVKRFTASFWIRRRWLNKTQWLAKNQLQGIQLDLLQRVVKHCYQYVPYYRNLMDERGIKVKDVKTLEDIHSFPILTKNDIWKAGKSLLSAKFPKCLLHAAHTGGTTGKRLPLFRDVLSIGDEHAFVRRQFDWAGIRLRDRVAYLTWRTVVKPNIASLEPYAYDPLMRDLILSTFHLSPVTIPSYVDAMEKYRVTALVGYPSAIGEIARWLIQQRKSLSIRSVLTTSETLGQEERKTISAAFRCPVYDFYGSAERVCYVHTCEKGNYHIIPEYGYTELSPAPAPNEDCFRLIATGFWNYAMPLIRYDTGDLVKPSDRVCPCGRCFPVIQAIVGRENTSIRTATGRVIGLTAMGRLLKNVLLRIPRLPIQDSQFVYTEDGDVCLEYVSKKGWGPDNEEELRTIVAEELPADLNIMIRKVSSLSRTSAGKSVSLVYI